MNMRNREYTELLKRPFNEQKFIEFIITEDTDNITSEYNECTIKYVNIDEMKKDITGYSSVAHKSDSINLLSTGTKYVLLPVWMLNIKYKDKIHTFAMNGQTGKIVGNIPIDKAKAVILWIVIFLLTFGILYLLSYLGVMS